MSQEIQFCVSADGAEIRTKRFTPQHGAVRTADTVKVTDRVTDDGIPWEAVSFLQNGREYAVTPLPDDDGEWLHAARVHRQVIIGGNPVPFEG